MNELSDWELKHEFDAAVMTKEDLFTSEYVQEDLSSAMCLPTSYFISLFDETLKKYVDNGRKDFQWPVNRFVKCFNYHVFLDVLNVGFST